jgi:hypothetical protein
MRELTEQEIDQVGGGVVNGAGWALIAVGVAAVLLSGGAAGFAIAGAAGVIGADAAFGGSLGLGIMGLGLGTADAAIGMQYVD